MKKAWSKLVPGVWFELITDETDERGMLPAMVHTPEGSGYTVVHEDTISMVEITAVPESIPDVMHAVAYGDPAMPQVEVFFTEREARTAANAPRAFHRPWGYFPVRVERNLMIPV